MTFQTLLCRRLCCIAPPPDKPEFSVLCVGLSKAGKSSGLCLLSGEDMDCIEPTVGFSVKAVIMDNCILNVKELGGGDSVRPYWDRYFLGSEAVVFVIAAACSPTDLDTNKTEFDKVCSHGHLKSLPLLLLISGQEKNGARTVDEISQYLDIQSQSSKRTVIIHPCNTDDRTCLRDAYTKLSNSLLKEGNTVDPKTNEKELNKI